MNTRQDVLEERLTALEEKLSAIQEQLETLPDVLTRCFRQQAERMDQRRNFLHPESAASLTPAPAVVPPPAPPAPTGPILSHSRSVPATWISGGSNRTALFERTPTLPPPPGSNPTSPVESATTSVTTQTTSSLAHNNSISWAKSTAATIESALWAAVVLARAHPPPSLPPLSLPWFPLSPPPEAACTKVFQAASAHSHRPPSHVHYFFWHKSHIEHFESISLSLSFSSCYLYIYVMFWFVWDTLLLFTGWTFWRGFLFDLV